MEIGDTSRSNEVDGRKSQICWEFLIYLRFNFSSYLIYRKMKANAKSMASFNASQDQARKRRNRSITLVLVGIIALFLVCHTGEVAVSIYEVRPCPLIQILKDFIQILSEKYLHFIGKLIKWKETNLQETWFLFQLFVCGVRDLTIDSILTRVFDFEQRLDLHRGGITNTLWQFYY